MQPTRRRLLTAAVACIKQQPRNSTRRISHHVRCTVGSTAPLHQLHFATPWRKPTPSMEAAATIAAAAAAAAAMVATASVITASAEQEVHPRLSTQFPQAQSLNLLPYVVCRPPARACSWRHRMNTPRHTTRRCMCSTWHSMTLARFVVHRSPSVMLVATFPHKLLHAPLSDILQA